MSDDNPKRPLSPELIIDPRSLSWTEPAYRGVLPHLEKPGCTYFVTFCLADVAEKRANERRRIERNHDPLEVAEFTDPSPVEGTCLFRDRQLAKIVEDALLYFQGDRYGLSAWCVMPNHVHAVVTPYAGFGLSKLLQSWKSFSAGRINRRLCRRGPVWQRESFDHAVRNAESHERFVMYVEQNPVTAGLVTNPADWEFSSARHRMDF